MVRIIRRSATNESEQAEQPVCIPPKLGNFPSAGSGKPLEALRGVFSGTLGVDGF